MRLKYSTRHIMFCNLLLARLKSLALELPPNSLKF